MKQMNMNNTTPNFPAIPTISSYNLVALINWNRKDEESLVRHDRFMVKVPKYFGEVLAAGFFGNDTFARKSGSFSRNVYNFPKLEAYSIAREYGYELTEKAFEEFGKGFDRATSR